MDNDDVDMLISLPNEILLEILSYVPRRFAVSLVCRKLYEIVVCLEKNKYELQLNDEKMLVDTLSFNSIINSKRELNSLKIKITTKMTELCWDRLTRIIYKFNPSRLSIMSFDLRRTTASKLCSAIAYCASSRLQDLSLSNISLDFLSVFFKLQNSIGSLAITGAVGNECIFVNLQLTELKLVGPKSKYLDFILKTQSNLKALKLTIDEETIYNNDTFNEILKLDQLETLDIPFNDAISSDVITGLKNLKLLKKLSVSCSSNGLQNLTETSIPSLQELDITLDSPGLSHSIDLMSKNIPNLKCLKFRGPLVINFLTDISVHYPNLESLWLENDESFFVNILNLNAPSTRNLSLKHLRLINRDKKFVLCSNDLILFLKALNNLQTVAITKNIDIQLNNFESILMHLPNLKEIVVDSKCFSSTTSVMNSIKSYGNNLQFVGFENFKLESDSISLQVFFEEKFSRIEKKNGNLILSSDKKAILSKVI